MTTAKPGSAEELIELISEALTNKGNELAYTTSVTEFEKALNQYIDKRAHSVQMISSQSMKQAIKNEIEQEFR